LLPTAAPAASHDGQEHLGHGFSIATSVALSTAFVFYSFSVLEFLYVMGKFSGTAGTDKFIFDFMVTDIIINYLFFLGVFFFGGPSGMDYDRGGGQSPLCRNGGWQLNSGGLFGPSRSASRRA